MRGRLRQSLWDLGKTRAPDPAMNRWAIIVVSLRDKDQKYCEQKVAKETKKFQKVFSPSLSSFASVRNPFGPAAMPVIALVIAPSPDKIARRVRGKFSNKKYQWKTSVAPAYEIGLIDDVVAWMR